HGDEAPRAHRTGARLRRLPGDRPLAARADRLAGGAEANGRRALRGRFLHARGGARRRPRGLEEEPSPGGPPVVGAADDLPRLDELDAVLAAVLLGRVRRRQLDLDLARAARVVRGHRREVAERLLGAGLDQLPRAPGRDLAGAVAARALPHGGGREAGAEELPRLLARRPVAGHEQDMAAPGPAQRRVDPRLADENAVEAQIPPRL